jgi:branched-chain amino acid transport system permease protein
VADGIAQAHASRPKKLIPAEMSAVLIMAVLGVLGYFFFPDDLAFLTRLISIALLVISLDLVTGYCGIATLGQSAIFGVSAYVVGNACLMGLRDPLALLVVGSLSGALMGLMSGALVTKFRGLPQLVLSIAIGQLVAALANKLSTLTGGSDGLSGIEPGRVFGIFAFDMYGRTGYVFSLAVLVTVFAVLLRVVQSPFGLMCRAIKDDALRARMMGVRIYPRLIVMYGISGVVAGIGGALNAINTGVVGLDSVSFERSAEALVMLVIGGVGSLWGALIGSVLFQLFEHYVSAANPFHWMTLLGLMLISVVLFAPRGVVSLMASLSGWIKPESRRAM